MLLKTFITGKEGKPIPVYGYKIGRDSKTGRDLFLPVGSSIVLINTEGSISTNNAILLADGAKLFSCSGCRDKRNGLIFDQDIIQVEKQIFLVYYSKEKLKWELVKLNEMLEPMEKPIALFRLKDAMKTKACVVSNAQYRCYQRSFILG